MPASPLIGITSDVVEHEGRRRCAVYPSYARAIVRAGGTPVFLSHEVEAIPGLLDSLHGLVFAGGDDPRTEEFGHPTDPRTTPMHADRQRFEVALLRALGHERPDCPVLGVCLGMQLMALVAGGVLDQHLPASCPTASEHWESRHEIIPQAGWEFGSGRVVSRHRQAVRDAGTLCVLARAPDGVIEAVGDPGRAFYLGVQWHPERSDDPRAGAAVMQGLVSAAHARATGT